MTPISALKLVRPIAPHPLAGRPVLESAPLRRGCKRSALSRFEDSTWDLAPAVFRTNARICHITAHFDGIADPATHVMISTGGTGISPRDGTFEAVTGLFEKRLDGFGELFRMISFEEIGAAAMLSRATAGTVGRKAIFALPGSEKAVRLAMTRLVIPELGHVVQQLSK